jgi:hypothetical protein
MPRWPNRRVMESSCEACGVTFFRYLSQIKRSERSFCSRACAMPYLNTARRQTAQCHPDREHAGLGWCETCYAERYHLRRQGWEDAFDRLNEEQGGVCAICEQPCRTGKRLAVDHDHQTGHVRGLLCRTCNSGIGLLNDDPDLLRKAADYIERTS